MYNETHSHDSYSKTHLNKNGLKHAESVSEYITSLQKDDVVVIITPLSRTFETIQPYLEEKFDKEFLEIQKKYETIQKIYQDLWNQDKIQEYIKDKTTQKLFAINETLYVDFRTTDIIIPEVQDQTYPTHLSISKPTNEKLSAKGESIDDVIARCKAYTIEVNEKFATKTIITITHKDSVILMQQTFKDFDYLTKKYEYSPDNGQIIVRYRDNTRKMEMDLHKPYVDSYRFII